MLGSRTRSKEAAMTVGEIPKEKGPAIYSIDGESSVMKAVKEMNRLRIGAPSSRVRIAPSPGSSPSAT